MNEEHKRQHGAEAAGNGNAPLGTGTDPRVKRSTAKRSAAGGDGAREMGGVGQDAESLDYRARRPRAVLYLRVSTAKQADTDLDPEGLSLPAQRQSCLRKAEELGADVVGEYVDRGESAKTVNRPQFQRMVARISGDRDVDFVILDKINRFARNRRDDANLLFELRGAGATIVSVKENIDDTPAGALMHGILATLAEYESRNNGTEALKGMTRKAQVGGTPGRAPIGYLNVREPAPGNPRGIATVVVDEERARHVRWAFEMYSTGEWTLRSLTDALEVRGFRSVPSGKKPSMVISKSRIGHMLSNRYYLGEINFRGMRYEGRHPAIVDQAVFDRVQTVLRLKATTGEKNFRHRHHLKGSLFCGECGMRMVFSRNRGNGGCYDYFKCMSKEYGRECSVGYVRADWLEDQVERAWLGSGLGNIHGAGLGSDGVDDLRQALLSELARRHETTGLELGRAAKQLDNLAAERTALVRAHLAGAVPLDLLKQEQDRITVEMAGAQGVIDAASVTTREIESTLNRALELAANCYQTYLDATSLGKRQLNQLFFERFEVFVDREPSTGDTGRSQIGVGVNADTTVGGTVGGVISGTLDNNAAAEGKSDPANSHRESGGNQRHSGTRGNIRDLTRSRTGAARVEGHLAAPFKQLAVLTSNSRHSDGDESLERGQGIDNARGKRTKSNQRPRRAAGWNVNDLVRVRRL